MNILLQCRTCSVTFSEDQTTTNFYNRVSPIFNSKKYQVPSPSICQDCRAQRRFSFRNERTLYHRTCDATGKDIVSFYRPDSPYKVYEHDAWWSDTWDALQYGCAIDLNRPFFEQFAKLQREVPRIAMVTTQLERCLYAPYCVECKSCYLCVSCVIGEDLYYCYQTNDSRSCIDCSLCTKCELCYDCLHCTGLFSSTSCQDCDNGSGLVFCQDCRGCTDCFGCKNLVNQKNYILNAPATPDDIAALRQELRSYEKREEFRRKVRQLFATLPTRATHFTNCENCTGDYLRDCRSCHDCFDAINLEDCAYIYPAPKGGTTSQDVHYSPHAELVYDSVSAVDGYDCKWLLHSWQMKHSMYTDECFSSEHLFGCIGLRNKRYCILNKQYTKAEYESLVPRLIEHMKKNQEWGEFFPTALSPFAYNETVAHEYYPLSKDEAVQRGYQWSEYMEPKPDVEKIISASQLSQTIDAIPDDVLQWAIECEVTRKPFKIIKQELSFYRTQGMALPRRHPEQRYKDRMAQRNPRKLWERQCQKCAKKIQTTFAPGRPEIMYCEECYLKEVY